MLCVSLSWPAFGLKIKKADLSIRVQVNVSRDMSADVELSRNKMPGPVRYLRSESDWSPRMEQLWRGLAGSEPTTVRWTGRGKVMQVKSKVR